MVNIADLTDKNFDSFIQENNMVIVDFWAPWCAPCKTMSPVIKAMAEKYENIAFAKVNSDENMGIAIKYAITNIPRFLIFKENKKVGSIMGAMPPIKFENQMKKILEL